MIETLVVAGLGQVRSPCSSRVCRILLYASKLQVLIQSEYSCVCPGFASDTAFRQITMFICSFVFPRNHPLPRAIPSQHPRIESLVAVSVPRVQQSPRSNSSPPIWARPSRTQRICGGPNVERYLKQAKKSQRVESLTYRIHQGSPAQFGGPR